jgi:AsmA protein
MARHARRLIIWTTGVLLSAALLAMLAIFLLIWGVDPDVYRARIERAATQALGRRVELTGALSWRPGANFEIQSLGGRIANVEGFGALSLASWQSLRLGVALRPLLDHRLVIDRIEIQGLRLNLARSAAGGNWSVPPSAPQTQDPQLALSVGHISLREGAVVFSDQVGNRAWSATQLALEVNLPAQLEAPVLRFSDLSMQARLQGPPLQQAGIAVQLKAPRIEVNRERMHVQLPEWQVMWDDTRLNGSISAGFGATPATEGAVRLRAPSLRRLLQSVSVAAPATRDDSAFGPLELGTQFRSGKGTVELTDLGLKLDSTRVEGAVRFTTLTPASLRFELSADEVDVDRYLSPKNQPGNPLSLPLAELKALDAKGVLVLRRARVAGAAAREMRIDVD